MAYCRKCWLASFYNHFEFLLIADLTHAGEAVLDVAKKAAEEVSVHKDEAHGHDHHHGHGHGHGPELHTYIGVSLVLGFIFMLLVDQLSGGMHVHPTGGERFNSNAQ